jgi:hypothetical protein
MFGVAYKADIALVYLKAVKRSNTKGRNSSGSPKREKDLDRRRGD